ncbi:MAG: hypothetical protein ABGW74_08600 [Campylobacterales bacterium]
MGWTCQHDFKGYCKLIKRACVPGMKGCILKQSGITFSTGSFEEDKKAKEQNKKEEIDFAQLARSN